MEDETERLRQLDQLHKDGILTDQEFAAKKAAILNIPAPSATPPSAPSPPATAAKKPGAARTGCLAIVLAFVLIVFISIVTSGSGSSGGNYEPAHFTADGPNLVKLTRAAINGASDSPGVNGTPTASCQTMSSTDSPVGAAGLNCTVSYTVKQPTGISTDLELVQPLRPIFRAMFLDPKVQGGMIAVSGPTTSTGGQEGNSPLFTIGCTRAADAQIDWSNVDEDGLKALCQFDAIAKGL